MMVVQRDEMGVADGLCEKSIGEKRIEAQSQEKVLVLFSSVQQCNQSLPRCI